jgi:hypothetical protein
MVRRLESGISFDGFGFMVLAPKEVLLEGTSR